MPLSLNVLFPAQSLAHWRGGGGGGGEGGRERGGGRGEGHGCHPDIYIFLTLSILTQLILDYASEKAISIVRVSKDNVSTF